MVLIILGSQNRGLVKLWNTILALGCEAVEHECWNYSHTWHKISLNSYPWKSSWWPSDLLTFQLGQGATALWSCPTTCRMQSLSSNDRLVKTQIIHTKIRKFTCLEVRGKINLTFFLDLMNFRELKAELNIKTSWTWYWESFCLFWCKTSKLLYDIDEIVLRCKFHTEHNAFLLHLCCYSFETMPEPISSARERRND